MKLIKENQNKNDDMVEIDKEKARKAFIKLHPWHVSLRITKTDFDRIRHTDQVRKNKERRLEIACRIDKLRNIDNLTLEKIGKEVGLSKERVRQILLKI